MTEVIIAIGQHFLGLALVIGATGWAIGYVIQSWRGVFKSDEDEE